MTALLARVYASLSLLPCQVTRLWPQALVPLPSVAFGIASARASAPGITQCTMLLEVRGSTPEAADTLAASALGRMAALGFTLHQWRDGEVTESGCFSVTLEAAGAFREDGAPALPPQVLVAQGGPAVPVGGVLQVQPLARTRAMTDITDAQDTVRRYAPQAMDLGRLELSVARLVGDPGQAMLHTAFDQGQALAVTVQDPWDGAVTRQGYVAGMTSSGPETTIIIQHTGQ